MEVDSFPPTADASDSLEAVGTVLDSLDALVYVSDIETHELLYINAYGRRHWGPPVGRKCWEVLQSGQSGPCEFCTNARLLDDAGTPKGVHVWEFQNTQNQRWYQCRDQVIRWPDGRQVRLEVATDITDRKLMEQALEEAKHRAEQLAHRDELTGLHNRRAFFALGEQLWRYAQRNNASIALIMFDLDGFKGINDRFGHAAGDRVLRAVGQTSKRLVRDSDILARLGGEEFAIVMMDSDGHDARTLAERLRQAIESTPVIFEGHSIVCSSSFGIDFDSPANASLDTLLKRADDAMYRAKRNGRNRVESRLIARDS
ncbi:diguanylate cyclase [Marinobacteraceae bacterium S3BR75-40.1]